MCLCSFLVSIVIYTIFFAGDIFSRFCCCLFIGFSFCLYEETIWREQAERKRVRASERSLLLITVIKIASDLKKCLARYSWWACTCHAWQMRPTNAHTHSPSTLLMKTKWLGWIRVACHSQLFEAMYVCTWSINSDTLILKAILSIYGQAHTYYTLHTHPIRCNKSHGYFAQSRNLCYSSFSIKIETSSHSGATFRFFHIRDE